MAAETSAPSLGARTEWNRTHKSLVRIQYGRGDQRTFPGGPHWVKQNTQIISKDSIWPRRPVHLPWGPALKQNTQIISKDSIWPRSPVQVPLGPALKQITRDHQYGQGVQHTFPRSLHWNRKHKFRLREVCRSDGQIRQKSDRSEQTYVLLGPNVRHCPGLNIRVYRCPFPVSSF